MLLLGIPYWLQSVAWYEEDKFQTFSFTNPQSESEFPLREMFVCVTETIELSCWLKFSQNSSEIKNKTEMSCEFFSLGFIEHNWFDWMWTSIYFQRKFNFCNFFIWTFFNWDIFSARYLQYLQHLSRLIWESGIFWLICNISSLIITQRSFHHIRIMVTYILLKTVLLAGSQTLSWT